MSEPKPPENWWLVTGVYIFGGLTSIFVAANRVLNPIEYPPGDYRASQAYVIGSTIFILAIALVFLGAGVMRLLRRR